MERPLITIHNAATDEIEIREMNDEEFASYKKMVEKFEAEKKAEIANAKAKAALLERLGITEEEAKLLLG